MRRRARPDPIDDLAPLLDPVRRKLYMYVLAAEADVGRDEAARALGIGRPLAAFHLDKLAEAGLLDVGYRRLSGRSGPGAGRPAKVYRSSGQDLHVSVPPRDYELAARLLLEGLEDSGGRVPALRRAAAKRVGTELGMDARSHLRGRPSKAQLTSAVVGLLETRGFQPFLVDEGIRLGNCPFHSLVLEYRDTVCALNLALLRGVVEGCGARHLRPESTPAPPGCCVLLRADEGGLALVRRGGAS